MSGLLDLAEHATDHADHGPAIDWLARAVRTLRARPESQEREVWLTEALVRLGNELRLTGDFSAAGAALTEACSRADTAELEPIRRAGARNALGILAKDTTQLAAAERWYAEAQALLEKAFGENDPRLASLQHNLAGLAHARTDFVRAEAHARHALKLRGTSAAGPSYRAGDLCVLGAALAGQGRHDEAETVLHDALRLWVRHGGPDHYEVAVVLHNLGGIQAARGNRAAAQAAFQRALAIKRTVLGDQHHEVVLLTTKLAALGTDRAAS